MIAVWSSPKCYLSVKYCGIDEYENIMTQVEIARKEQFLFRLNIFELDWLHF